MHKALYVFQVGISLEIRIHPQRRFRLVTPPYKQSHSDTSEVSCHFLISFLKGKYSG